MNDIADIQEYMRREGMKQYELAAQIGAPAQTIHRWLRGKANISRAYRVVLETKGILPSPRRRKEDN